MAKPKSEIKRADESLQYFFTQLVPKLKEMGLEDDQIKKINRNILEANQSTQEEMLKKQQIASSPGMDKLLGSIGENIKDVLQQFSPNQTVLFVNAGIAVLIIVALVFLAAKGLLEPTQTSTLFGGIVGYLLGNTTR